MDLLKRHISWIPALVLVVIIGWRFISSPPRDFPAGSIVSIAKGASAPEVAAQLANAHIIAHPSLLRTVLRVTGQSARIQAGAYLFKTPEHILAVAYRLTTGTYGLPPVRITFPEGETMRDVAARVVDAFPDISTTDFLSAAQPYEGYLFPDTYLFLPSTNAASSVALMRENFNTKLSPLMGDITASGHSLSDVVILASLVEKEARTIANRRIVAGILWHRLALGMPLQVDA